MCAGAAMLARVERIVLGGWDPKLGACGSVWDVVRDRRATHRAEVVGGVLEEECGAVVRRFFEGAPRLSRRARESRPSLRSNVRQSFGYVPDLRRSRSGSPSPTEG